MWRHFPAVEGLQLQYAVVQGASASRLQLASDAMQCVDWSGTTASALTCALDAALRAGLRFDGAGRALLHAARHSRRLVPRLGHCRRENTSGGELKRPAPAQQRRHVQQHVRCVEQKSPLQSCIAVDTTARCRREGNDSGLFPGVSRHLASR